MGVGKLEHEEEELPKESEIKDGWFQEEKCNGTKDVNQYQ